MEVRVYQRRPQYIEALQITANLISEDSDGS